MSISTSCEKTLFNWMILLRDKFIFQWRIEQKRVTFLVLVIQYRRTLNLQVAQLPKYMRPAKTFVGSKFDQIEKVF